MKNLKELMNTLRAAEENANKADEAWGMDPENEELEAAFDNAYEKEFAAFDNLVNGIVDVTAGKIDRNQAKAIVIMRREQLESLVARIA